MYAPQRLPAVFSSGFKENNMFNHHDITRDACMLHGPLARHGYD